MSSLNTNIKFIYFLGIGGIGMSALARHFHHLGYSVSGYDKTPSIVTQSLEELGIQISFDDRMESLPENVIAQIKNTLVVYTPAIPNSSLLLAYFKQNDYTLVKRSAILGEITQQYKTLAIAGTHGKTTTSSILAHILFQSEVNTIAFLGGITSNYNSNYLYQENAELMVVEADEFDKSFLTLNPQMAVITSVDADHLDIYGTHKAMLTTFNEFANVVQNDGVLFIHKSIENLIKNDNATTYTYSATQKADLNATDIQYFDGIVNFKVEFKEEIVGDFSIGMPGIHNIENALVSIGIALLNHVSVQSIQTSLAQFKGIKRRFEFIVKNKDFTYIDDYAHHPTEIEAAIKAAKELYPGKKITAVFQPHLFSRTRDFIEGFANALSLANELILLEIYPARELPIEGINSKILLEKVSINNKQLLSKEDTINFITEHKNSLEVLMTLGAGDIDRMVSPIKNIFN